MRETLRRRWAEAQAAWPGVVLDEDAFASHVVSKLAGDGGPEEVARLDTEGLYLACACARGSAPAMAALDLHVLARVPEFLSRMRGSSELAEDVRQLLRVRLLVATEGEPPRIATYSGDGPLAAWVRTIAIRTALNVLEKRDEHVAHDGAAVERVAGGKTPEEELLAVRQRAVFREILEEAVSALPAEQRAALRMHFAEGLSGDEIGERLDISRATVVRWLATARSFLLRETRRLLRDRLRFSPEDADSFIAAARSRLDLSLSGLFASEERG
jgi:RNA polymerase sigma-70 factor (ECF subfamily)